MSIIERKCTDNTIGEAEQKAMNRLEEVDIFAAPLLENNDRPTNMPKEFWLRKADRPDYETLCKEIRQLGFVGTGKKYGVSDNAVRKWKKNYELQFEN